MEENQVKSQSPEKTLKIKNQVQKWFRKKVKKSLLKIKKSKSLVHLFSSASPLGTSPLELHCHTMGRDTMYYIKNL